MRFLLQQLEQQNSASVQEPAKSMAAMREECGNDIKKALSICRMVKCVVKKTMEDCLYYTISMAKSIWIPAQKSRFSCQSVAETVFLLRLEASAGASFSSTSFDENHKLQ